MAATSSHRKWLVYSPRGAAFSPCSLLLNRLRCPRAVFSCMKEFFICDCSQHENKIITSTFVVVVKQVKPKKSGDPYLALTLGDRSGQIEAKMWDNVEDAIDAFEQDDFL